MGELHVEATMGSKLGLQHFVNGVLKKGLTKEGCYRAGSVYGWAGRSNSEDE